MHVEHLLNESHVINMLNNFIKNVIIENNFSKHFKHLISRICAQFHKTINYHMHFYFN
jgi:hypothetical protein